MELEWLVDTEPDIVQQNPPKYALVTHGKNSRLVIIISSSLLTTRLCMKIPRNVRKSGQIHSQVWSCFAHVWLSQARRLSGRVWKPRRILITQVVFCCTKMTDLMVCLIVLISWSWTSRIWRLLSKKICSLEKRAFLSTSEAFYI